MRLINTVKNMRFKKTTIIILILCFFQLIIVTTLTYQIYLKTQVLGVSISPVDKNSILISPDQNLSHFYEHKPNTTFEFKSYGFEGNFGKGHINSDGLNEVVEYSVEKDKSTFRIIALGDSFTFGWFVNTSENYPEQLEKKLNSLNCKETRKFEVLNLGVGAYDIEYAAHRFEKRGKKYNPDLVLWLVKNDDFSEIADYLFANGAKEYEKIVREGRLEYYHNLGVKNNPGWYEARQELKEKMSLREMTSYQIQKLYSFNKLYDKKLVLFTPYRILPEATENLAQFSRDRPQTWFDDSLPALHKNEEVFPDGHPTVKGYTKIANHLYDYLIKNRIIPCS